MKSVYRGIFKLGRNEGFAVVAISMAFIVAYSFWGAYILHTQGSLSSTQVSTIGN